MNKAKLKTYAPQARKDFIAAVTARAQRLGLDENNGQLRIAPAESNGDLVMIAGQSWPAQISRQRDNLIASMRKHGYAQTLENTAYTWFNRFAALRYMEIQDYLSHGYRVLSSREGGLPEILGHAPELARNGDLPGLNPQQAVELKLAGDRDGELYRLALIAQCNALSHAMPFLFERIDDETELLLPDNLLLTDSVIAKLVNEIPEQDWSQVEIIGWLYQFYISEKKDRVIGKVVKSEDIPAATQLFTPNWIVQYLVQNSIGRLWLMANPASTLKNGWPYYIEPAAQTPEVQAQLDALIQTRMAEDGGSLNPETLTVLDPACGSGHILVEAYEVLKAIYLERGYQPRAIPRLILEKNLYGLDIDDRAAQLAGFALLMKARADDRRLLDNPPRLNVLALQESKGLDADELAQALSSYDVLNRTAIISLLDTFAHANTFGSLIQIHSDLNMQLSSMEEALSQAIQSGDLFTQAAAFDLLPMVRQARILGMQVDTVVANPPYMGSKGMNTVLKDYAKRQFPDSKADLFAMFIERGFDWCKSSGFNAMVTMQAWMFLSSFERLRNIVLHRRTITNMAHFGPRGFGEISGEVVQTTAFSIFCSPLKGLTPVFFRLTDGNEEEKRLAFLERKGKFDKVAQDDFLSIPGHPFAYWTSEMLRLAFKSCRPVGDMAEPKQGISTCNNDLFLRYWYEVEYHRIGFDFRSRTDASQSGKRWFPYNKGGSYRKWYGNNEYVVNWESDGKDIHEYNNLPLDYNGAPMRGKNWFFHEGMTWSSLSSGSLGGRYTEPGFIFADKGPVLFPNDQNAIPFFIALYNSEPARVFLEILAPTLDFAQGPVGRLPFPRTYVQPLVSENATQAIRIAKDDWNCFESAWGFTCFPLISGSSNLETVSESWCRWETHTSAQIKLMRSLEKENNRLLIEAYGLQDELSPEVPEEQITLARADREKDCQRLISYAIGCMMGRYSLDEPGLIYAHAGNIGFDSTRYKTFPADADGIVPITDELWFEDDAANRIREFLLAVWSAETLEENMAWLAESLGQKANETPEETIRRYLAGSFFKDHLQTYKKRPIYWLFSSGKQGAFQALVYLHRYHEGTLARMRAEYVVPLTGKIQSRIEHAGKGRRRRIVQRRPQQAEQGHRKTQEKTRRTARLRRKTPPLRRPAHST